MEHWDRLRGDQGFYWDDGHPRCLPDVVRQKLLR